MVREPFQLRLDEIRRLDRWVVSRIYFHPTDKETGAITISSKGTTGPKLDKRGWFYEHWRRFGLPDHRIEFLYQKELDRHRHEQRPQS